MSQTIQRATNVSRGALAAILALSLAGVSERSVLAQETPGVFGEVIDVRVVNVEVVVTDKDGIRVTGLAPEDFRLTVDGEAVPVDFFTEVRGGDAVLVEAGPGAAPVPGLPALAPGERVGTSYLVFVDDFFSIARDRDQVLEGLVDQLSMLAPEDRMAIVAYDGRGLTMLSSWSGSQRVLEKALKEAMRRPALGLQRLAERRNHDLTTTDVRRGRASLGFSQSFRLSVEERVYADQLAAQVGGAVGAAAATLRGFASPPGRKVLLLLSGGWPYSPAAYAVDDLTRALSGDEARGGAGLFAPLTDTANLLGYTVYPVDVPGLGNDFGADVNEGGRLATGLGEDRFADSSVAGSRERERDVQQALHYVAGETGGTALINARRLEALPQVVTDTRSYYWIGFSPTRRRDDGAHDIRVEVGRPGFKVRSREGFRDLSRAAENDMAVESALLFGDAPTTGALGVTLGEIVPAGRKQVEVPITLNVPLDLMTLVPVDGGWATAFELRVAALDDQRRRSDIPRIPVELKFKQRPPAGSVVPYQTRLKLRRERQTVVVSVLDPVGGASLTGRLEISP